MIEKLDMEAVLGKLSNEFMSASQVSDILNNPQVFPTALIEKLSIETALQYWKGQMTYEEGDRVMNNLYSFWITNDYFVETFGFSDIAWECYEAFDSGEYRRSDDDKNINLDEKYTRPLIENLLRRNNLIA